MSHKISLLWAWFVMLTTDWLPDMPSVMRFRGALLSWCMKECGKDFQVASGARIRGLTTLSVGNHVYFANNVLILAGDIIEIADEVMLGPFVVVAAGNHVSEAGSFRFAKSATSPVRINRGAWLAAHCTVTAGVQIGAGSLIGANSVVTEDIPTGVMAAGSPAVVKRAL